ncbi:hypothetical protein ACK8HX_16610, partial [Oryzobacter sp. R7]|uniref:hypothetical protein n=1 Tax=Oryzobacter faecalis TaxID=3388656 RepID=UPI00398CF94E
MSSISWGLDRRSIESRVAALRRECAALACEVASGGRALGPDHAFELAGAAQGLVNSADGLVGVLAAWGARVETALTSHGPVQRVRQVAQRVAADQVAAQARRCRRGRTVEVRPGEDGLTSWWALLPAATSAAAWAAVDQLA